MARIRTIKPEFLSSPSMRGANPWARILYAAMWMWADDTGRGTANVRELAAFAFPDEEDPIAPTVTELPYLLAEVQRRWHVIFYRVDGRRYFAIPTFDDHQRNERRAKSRYPGPEAGETYDPGPPDQPQRIAGHQYAAASAANDGNTVQPPGASSPGTGEQGNRGTGEQGNSAPTELALVPRADAEPAANPERPSTLNKRAQALAKTYRERAGGLTNFAAVMKIAKAALEADWQDEAVDAALARLIDDNRPVTKDSLRVELQGPTRRRASKPSASERAQRTLAHITGGDTQGQVS